jgi:hypothetical protein
LRCFKGTGFVSTTNDDDDDEIVVGIVGFRFDIGPGITLKKRNVNILYPSIISFEETTGFELFDGIDVSIVSRIN